MSGARDAGAPGRQGKQKGARANREGKPWKRDDGRWAMRVYPPEGSIRAKPFDVYGRTRAEVKEKHRKRLAELTEGIAPQAGDKDIKVGPYMRRWLYTTLPQYVKAGAMKETTMYSYQENAELHIIPEAGSRDILGHDVPTLAHIGLLALTAGQVREWQEGMLAKPSARQRVRLRPGEAKLPPPVLLSPRTVAYNQTILQKALNDAVRDEVGGLKRNVVLLVDMPDGKKKTAKAQARKVARRVIRPEAAAPLLVAMAEDPLWCYWLVGFAQGFRRGEGLGMRWPDLDLGALTWTPGLQVQRVRGPKDPQTGRRKGKLVATELKSDESAEPVALTRTAASALARWEAEQNRMRLKAPRWAELDLVFTTRFGTAIEPRRVNEAWGRLCARAGAPEGTRLHDLRHACASYALAGGADSKSVQAYLRHARLATTELYLHAVQEVPRSAADVMDRVIADLQSLGSGPGPDEP